MNPLLIGLILALVNDAAKGIVFDLCTRLHELLTSLTDDELNTIRLGDLPSSVDIRYSILRAVNCELQKRDNKAMLIALENGVKYQSPFLRFIEVPLSEEGKADEALKNLRGKILARRCPECKTDQNTWTIWCVKCGAPNPEFQNSGATIER